MKKNLVVVSDTPVEEQELSAWFWVFFGLAIFFLVILILLLVYPEFFMFSFFRGSRTKIIS